MRKILFILLLFPLTLSAQTFFPVQNLYVKDAFRFGSFYFVKNADSLWLEKPLGTYICRLDTNIIGTGSTITASDGVYMDGDTMKLGGNATYNDFTVYKLVDDKYFDITDVNENFGLSFSTFSGNYGTTLKGGLVGWPRSSISANSSGVNLGYSKTSGGNTLTLQVNDGGAVFSEMPDTTLTTPNHLMTEQQVKREIAAAQRWTDISGGISYGNEVTIGSLAGTGDRNIGVDASGKLKVLNGGISDNTSDTVIYNAKFMTTSSTDTYCVYTIPTDGKYLLMSNLEIDFYDGCTVAASTIFGEMYYGEYDYVSTGIYVPTVSGETRQHDSRNLRHVVTTLTAGTVVKTIAYTNTMPSAGKLVCRVYLTVIKL